MTFEIAVYTGGGHGGPPNYVFRSPSPFFTVVPGQFLDVPGQISTLVQQVRHVFEMQGDELKVHRLMVITR